MQLGRSDAFLQRLLPAVRQYFGEQPAFSAKLSSPGISASNRALSASMPTRSATRRM
jgi:hypothetical protein